MATNDDRRDHTANTVPDKDDSKLERIAKIVDPPGRDVKDDDLNDPGRMTPGAPPVDNRS